MRAEKPVLTRPVLVASIHDEPLQVTVETTEAERAALALADGLVGLPRLEGRFELKHDRMRQGIAVTGEVAATLVQTCTVSLDPFESDIVEPVDLIFVTAGQYEAWNAQHAKASDPEHDAEDPPDLIVDGRIDLGQVTAEFLALGIDPYPRKPGVAYEADETAERDPSPFAVLAQLKQEH